MFSKKEISTASSSEMSRGLCSKWIFQGSAHFCSSEVLGSNIPAVSSECSLMVGIGMCPTGLFSQQSCRYLLERKSILDEMKAIYKTKCIWKKFHNSENIILGITETSLKIIWRLLKCLSHPIHNPVIKIIFQNLNVKLQYHLHTG